MISRTLKIDEVYDTLIKGIKDFFASNGVSKAVIGLSGGIDSAVVASLAVKALGKESVHGLLMPGEFSTLSSIQDAVDLADNLDINYNIVPISSVYKKFMKELQPVFGNNNKWNVAEENLQARIRGTLLMAYSNKFNALVLNTTNKSEMSVGYGTLYGDLAGAVMVLADLYKTEVYELARYINSENSVIPKSTITKAPSDELRDGQKDSDSLPDYHKLDPILYAMNEEGKSREELLKAGIECEIIDKITTLKKSASFKYLQTPPVLNISTKPLVNSSKWLL